MPHAKTMTYSTAPSLRKLQLGLTCCSVVANALSAGGVFIFPLISPALATHLKLTQPQLTTIALAGMVGQYPFAPVVGKVFDVYGPRVCSFAASILFPLGFGLFSWEIAKTPDDITQPPASSFQVLSVLFFVAGLATVFSFFSALFSASKNFPDYSGVATGTTMALFGLSPLFLSLIASNFFTDPESGLDVARFLCFLAMFTGSINLIGAINLKIPNVALEPTQGEDPERPRETDERRPLLPKRNDTVGGSTLDLLHDPCFWILALILIFTIGPCEMIISNMGTIVLSLPRSAPAPYASVPPTDLVTSAQVKLISITNTLSRLLAGPLADYISPVVSYSPTSDAWYSRKHRVSRVSFISATSLILAATFFWADARIRSREALWALSVGTGTVYGVIFTVLPSILAAVWGVRNVGRNFGIISYAPVVGTPLFSYIYAFVSAHHAQDDGVCLGVSCWHLTFLLCAGAALLAFFVSTVLWRTWKGRV